MIVLIIKCVYLNFFKAHLNRVLLIVALIQ